jgi:hypothetical protein
VLAPGANTDPSHRFADEQHSKNSNIIGVAVAVSRTAATLLESST